MDPSGALENREYGNSAGPCSAARSLLHARARELASVAGRASPDVTQRDYERAKREVTGETDTDRQDARLA